MKAFAGIAGLFGLIGIIVLPVAVYAAFSFVVLSGDPARVTSKDQEIRVNLQISGLPSESYFRAALKKEGTDSYIGYLKNDRGDWVKISALGDSDACQNYFRVSDIAASSASFFIKIGEDSKAESGMYVLKAHRFTATCKTYSDSSEPEEVRVTVTLPTVTPTPTVTPKPTDSPTIKPTNTPTQTPKATLTPANTSTVTLTPTVSVDTAVSTVSGQSEFPAEVLGETQDSKDLSVSTASGYIQKPLIISTALISLGLAILSGVFLFRGRLAGTPKPDPN